VLRNLVIWALLASCAPAQTWIVHPSGTMASLRGVSAAGTKVVWASGTGGVYLRTTDGGVHWRTATVPGAEALDFRDVHAVSDRIAYLLSSGPGDKSRIYKTTDGGAHWTLQLTNPDPNGFLDAIAFWDAEHGIVVGDPVGGQFMILTTEDGGARWLSQHTPAALPKEGAFAASGTCLIVTGRRDAWFGTGGPSGARVFHSTDRGRTWSVAQTPVRHDAASAGIFSIAFSDSRHGIVVGGDYSKPAEGQRNVAVTSGGGQSWVEPPEHPSGYRSAVAFVRDRKIWVTVGTSGSDVSYDNGMSWTRFDTGAYNAVSFASSKAGWAVGPEGRLAQFRLASEPAKLVRPAP
jgi:photosystem II stability/assembly factor-like uncharacterized protein